MRRSHITINLPIPVVESWERTRVGYSHTKFAVAGLAAIQILPEGCFRDLMTRVAAVDEGKADWQIVENWTNSVRNKLSKAWAEETKPRPKRTPRSKR